MIYFLGGCYIPCEYGTFSLKKIIISRAGEFLDRLDSSSFENEMKEINNMLKMINDNSLVLIDELCRSTNPKEGLALSIAICEYILIKKIGYKKNIFVFYATHFLELNCLKLLYFKVNSYQFDTYLDENKIIRNTFKLKIYDSLVKTDNYGIKLNKIIF
jgi:DNA mismatch repair protein MSH4